MTATRVITALDPATGARITRRTARTYVAVVVTGDPAQGHAWAQNWCGRPELAAKQLAKWGPDSHARLAPVMADPWATPEAQATPAPEATPTPEATPAPAAPARRPLAPSPLQGEARVLMARFSRCYRLAAPQAQALGLAYCRAALRARAARL